MKNSTMEKEKEQWEDAASEAVSAFVEKMGMAYGQDWRMAIPKENLNLIWVGFMLNWPALSGKFSSEVIPINSSLPGHAIYSRRPAVFVFSEKYFVPEDAPAYFPIWFEILA